jgi:AAHS family benzoate transporter-like MFS transporter
MLADKFGRKKILIIGICLYSAFTGLCGMIESVQLFAVLRFVAGFGLAGVIPLVSAVLSEYSPKANRNFLGTFTILGNGIGMTLCTLIGLIVLSRMKWNSMYLFAFIPFILVVFLIFFYPESMVFLVKRGDNNKIAAILRKANPAFVTSPDDQYEITAIKQTKVPLLNLFTDGHVRNTILIWIIFFVNFYLNFGISTWMPKLMSMMEYSLPGLTSTLIYFCGGLLGAPVAGLIANKVGLKRVMAIDYIVSTILVLAFTIKMEQTAFVVFLFVMGAFLNIPTLLTFSFASQNFPLHIRGTALGWSSGIGRIGAVVAPVLVGILVTAALPVTTIFGLFAIPTALGAICILLTKKDVTRHTKTDTQQ